MLIEAERLALGYDGVEVVHDVSLRVAPGEFVAIVGPNASGKSTLLRGLGRLLRPLAGRVCYDGEDARRIRSNEVARRLALLPQLPELDVDLTVEELVWRGRTPYQRALGGATEADYTGIPESVTIAAGQSEAPYYVQAVPDEEDETGEGLRLDFGPLPPGVRKGIWGPYETIEFLDAGAPASANLSVAGGC